jgi:hypothetical protein
MGFAIDPARVIPFTRVPVVKLSDLSALTNVRGELVADKIALPPRNPADEALGPASSGNPASDTDVTQLRAEFKVDGKVIARVYNSGQTEFAGGYGHLSDALAKRMVDTGTQVGPERADTEIDALTDLLKASIEGGATGETESGQPRMKYADCFVTKSATALTQDQWLAMKAATPGSIVSVEA